MTFKTPAKEEQIPYNFQFINSASGKPLDSGEGWAKYQQIDEILSNDMPLIPLYARPVILDAEFEDEDTDQEHPPFHGNLSVIPLRPGPLAIEDGWEFVRRRLYRETDRRESLNIQEDHIKAIMTAYDGRMTIRLLVDGLAEVFEQIIRADSPRDVSYSDLASQFILAPPIAETGSS